MEHDIMLIFGYLIAGLIVIFAWLWCVIDTEEKAVAAWKELRERARAIGGD